MGTTDAKCQVQNKKQKVLDLNVLPAGIRYIPQSDVLQCYQSSACYELIITGCTRVDCLASKACYDTRLVDNKLVNCNVSNACLDMHVEQGHDVICNATHRDTEKPCVGASVETEMGTFYCLGPSACITDRNNRVGARVGTHGTIHCENNQNRQFACHNLMVEIKHGHRACYDRMRKPERGDCAFLCANDYDCDTEQTEFHVEGES
ncbi:hypothetical protein ACA910_006921 [Epithemia clementina (nom. ined.)]